MSNYCPHCDKALQDVDCGRHHCPHCKGAIVIPPEPQLVINTPLGMFEFSGPVIEKLEAQIPELLRGILGFKK